MIRLMPSYVVATILYCVFLFMLSAQSNPPKPDLGFEIPGLDKIAHAVLYGGLAGVLSVGLYRSNATIKPAALFYIPIAFAVLYGVSDEIHQLYVPERSFELLDLLADGVGATTAQLVLCGIVWRRLPHATR